jgi:hypothetical protein
MSSNDQPIVNPLDLLTEEQETNKIFSDKLIKPRKSKSSKKKSKKKGEYAEPIEEETIVKLTPSIKIDKEEKAPITYINPTLVKYISMDILHSPYLLDKKINFIGLKKLYPTLQIITTQAVGRTLNEVKNTKFKVIHDSLLKISPNDFIFYIDSTLNQLKKIDLAKIPTTTDLAVIKTLKNSYTTDIMLFKASRIRELFSVVNNKLNPKQNLQNIINYALQHNFKIEYLNNYVK